MKIEYTIGGMTLQVSDLMDICQYYAAACTAEVIMENFPQITNEEAALQIGYTVRDLMAKYDYSEDEAIDHLKTNRPELFHS